MSSSLRPLRDFLRASSIALFNDDTRRRNGSLFSVGKGLNPLILNKTLFALPHVDATFVSSHNVCHLTLFSIRRPKEDFGVPQPS